MAGYVNTSAPITARALEIARDSLPDEYRGAYLFYRDSVPRTGMTESYTIALCDNLVQTETGYSLVITPGTASQGHQVRFISFGFYEVPANAPDGTEGVCWWHYNDASGYVQWPVESQAGTLVYGSGLNLPRLKTIGGDWYAFAILGLLSVACVYGLVCHAWHQLHCTR